MRPLAFFTLLLALACAAFAQTQAAPPATSPSTPDASKNDISGMYSFLQEAEFVQIDIEDGTKVTGYISRSGDLPSDKGAFLDHLIKTGELKGNALHFITKNVHGVWFEFTGTVETDAKNEGKEGYHLLKGKLTQYSEDGKNKTSAKSREVTLKSFPMGQ